jgi:phenylacetate-coenzyme A ligase PaaK-like adenylate-forming protein
MSRLQRLKDMVRAMRTMKDGRERERWTRERMVDHQSRAVDSLVRHAVEHSPFHRERLGEHVDAGPIELSALPVLDKASLMESIDDALCDPRLRGVDLRVHLGADGLLLGEHHVMASSGSTGRPSLYVYSRDDWTGILAMLLRLNEFAGIRPRLPRLRIVAIGAPTSASMTRRVGAWVDVGIHRLLRLSAADPLPRLVEELNAFRPQAINTFPSIGALLAEEQLGGRLRIAPEVVVTSSELQTPEIAERMERAFGVRPYDVFGSTEGLWGAHCEHHRGIHLFEDWCVFENVDGDGRPVPDGQAGERLLVTNLFNRTLPMIRFEISDSVAIDRTPCECGRTLPRMVSLQGRSDDVLSLPGTGSTIVAVHPTQFSPVAADPSVREFQIAQRGERVRLRLVLKSGADSSEAVGRVTHAVDERLRSLGVERASLETEIVPAIERTGAGKLRLVVIEEPLRERVAAR